ncbi:hypothetical protein F5Y13DRAFT_193304 [Hypoxylon sp. FL1857]|nr:hypothetical protein F5Y13DRAFT_193304 [Hypoxylon sp. FL1857]
MCTTVQFIYRCGYVETTTFKCTGSTTSIVHLHYARGVRRRRRRRRCYGSRRVISTPLDEDCHDCSSEVELSPPVVPVNILRERDPNLPTPSPPTGAGLLDSYGDYE